MPRTIADVVAKLPSPPIRELPAPPYDPVPCGEEPEEAGLRPPGKWNWHERKVGLAVESMRRHTTDEGWQLFAGLHFAGYSLAGYGLITTDGWNISIRRWSSAERHGDMTDVPEILEFIDPSVVVLQDKREWEGLTAGGPYGQGYDEREKFTNVEELKRRNDVFKLTVLKDAQNRPEYHRQSADEIGCHAWITYYHPKVVKHVAPFVREKHLVRTYHSIDMDLVPEYEGVERLPRCLLSGALSRAYPLRERIHKNRGSFPLVVELSHPGYHRRGCHTPDYLKILSNYRAAICTSSIYGYALRKIIEATACGCKVITDLPTDEVLPEIDGNLIRIDPDAPTAVINQVMEQAVEEYNPDEQACWAECAGMYDYRLLGKKLAGDIESMRLAVREESAAR